MPTLSPLTVECPSCHLVYALRDLGVSEAVDTHATITCTRCRVPFDLWVDKVPVAWWKVWDTAKRVSARIRPFTTPPPPAPVNED